jgi:bifunctional ADP-heptose synthase (sugar kinase/adenylyltransferase)
MKKVLVIGDSCIDQFIYGESIRLCPDAPIPVFSSIETIQGGGMAANTKANIESLGMECDILTQQESIVKTRYVDKKTNHMFIRVDTGEDRITRIDNIDIDLLQTYDAIAISDYDKGYLLREDIETICECHDTVFIDTKKPIHITYRHALFIKINEVEFTASKDLLTSPIGQEVFNDNLIITLGAKGCKYKDRIYPVSEVEVKDMSGAGDTFLSGLIADYLSHYNIEKAIKFANTCATKVVQKRGVGVV